VDPPLIQNPVLDAYFAEAKMVMRRNTAPPSKDEFEKISECVLRGERLSFSQGLFLFHYPDIEKIGHLSDFVRNKKCGNEVLLRRTLYLYPTNHCSLACRMCSFWQKESAPRAYFHTPEELEEQLKAHLEHHPDEVHIVSGVSKRCTLAYFKELFSRIRSCAPSLHIKALTAVEYFHMAKEEHISISDVLRKMKEYGVDSIPGGGAEILVDSVRKKIAPKKISSSEFLSIHKTAHQLLIPTNMTMLYGHIEDEVDILTHLLLVRKLQDETGGIGAFIPLQYSPKNNILGRDPSILKPKDPLRIFAISRLMLDNISHIKVLWNYVGIAMAEKLLFFGADDFSSVHINEAVAASCRKERHYTERELEEAIERQKRVVKRPTCKEETL
jgi:aminodeoxyfutalosine synthase